MGSPCGSRVPLCVLRPVTPISEGAASGTLGPGSDQPDTTCGDVDMGQTVNAQADAPGLRLVR
jgi:hypothetical protein